MDTTGPDTIAIRNAIDKFVRNREWKTKGEQERAPKRRDDGGSRRPAPRKNRNPEPAPGGAGEERRVPGAVELPPEYEKTPEGVLTYIESLAGTKDYFKKLEEALKSNVSLLVPNFISFSDFTKTLSNLRLSNMEVERAQGTHTEDPLSAIREFLAGE